MYKTKFFLWTLYLLTLSTSAFAENSSGTSHSAPIEIKADQLQAEQKKGIAIYRGHVIAQQGQFFLYSDRLEVHVKDGKVQKIIAYGSPAKFKKYDLKAQGWTHGKAKQITYTPTPQKQLQMLHSAQVILASGETLASEFIQYLINSKTLTATGTKQQRVHVILPTNQKSK